MFSDDRSCTSRTISVVRDIEIYALALVSWYGATSLFPFAEHSLRYLVKGTLWDLIGETALPLLVVLLGCCIYRYSSSRHMLWLLRWTPVLSIIPLFQSADICSPYPCFPASHATLPAFIVLAAFNVLALRAAKKIERGKKDGATKAEKRRVIYWLTRCGIITCSLAYYLYWDLTLNGWGWQLILNNPLPGLLPIR